MQKPYSKVVICFFASLLALSCASTKKEAAGYKGFGRDSVTEEQLKTYAPQPISPLLKNKIEKYMDVRSPSAGLPAPGGNKLFVNWSVTGTNQIWRIDGPLHFPVQMTGGEDGSYARGISYDGKWLIVSRDSMGDEFYGIYLQSVDGGALTEVFKKSKVRASFQGFSKDSQWVYYAANDIQENSNAIYRYNIKSKTREVIFSEPGLWRIGDMKDSDNLILVKDVGSRQNEHYHFSPTTKQLTPIIGKDLKQDFDVAFSTRVGEYFVLTDQLRDFRSLYSLKNGKLIPIKELAYNIEFFGLDEARTKLVYGINEKGYSRVYALTASTLKELPLPQFKNAEQVYGGAFSPDGRYITFAVVTAKAPNTNYVYDFNTKKLVQWALPSSPEINTQNFVGAQLESYRAEDGTQIPMFVWRSEECKTKLCPVIVDFHGGPEGQSTPGFSPTINLYLEQGFVYVEPNVRGSDGYGKKWLDSDNGANRLKVISDIRDCARYIKEKWKIKEVSPKVGIFGGSYGGYATLVGMSKFAGEYDAGVAIVGMSNLVSFIENTAPYRRALRMNEYGDPSKDKDVMLELSPITYVKQVKQPILIIHGASDPRVPAGEALQFYQEVKSTVPEAGMILFPDEGHGVGKRPNRVLVHGYVLEFFKKHLVLEEKTEGKPK